MAYVYGTNSGETLNGADGTTNEADEIYGLDGDDFIYANGGGDMLKGGGGADYLNGGAGYDFANYTDSTEGVTVSLLDGSGSGGTAEGDTLVNIEALTGSSHDDTLIGDDDNNHLDGWQGDDFLFGMDGQDTLTGGTGDDYMKGGGGSDILVGGSGVDTASYGDSDAGVGIQVDISDALSETGGDASGDLVLEVENVIGTAWDDEIFGNNENNLLSGQNGEDLLEGSGGVDTLEGGAGNDELKGGIGLDTLRGGIGDDTLRGNDGHDTLNGGVGNDMLVGNKGNDMFVFDTALNAATNVDTIVDFAVNKDEIRLDMDIFTGIGGVLNAGEFRIGGGAQDANDRIIYNANNGKLFFDSNGNAAGGKVQFAELDGGLALDHQDFLMI